MKIKSLFFLVFPILIACDGGSSSEISIEVVISNGKLQCQDNAIPISTTKGYLTDSGISVKSEKCGIHKGIDFPAFCSGETGQVHIFTINKKDLNEAENLGFIESSTFEEGFELVECDSL